VRVRSGPATVTRMLINKKIWEVRTSAPPVVVASRVRRPDPDMPRAWIPAGRV
jgi:hypothetical protein